MALSMGASGCVLCRFGKAPGGREYSKQANTLKVISREVWQSDCEI